MNRELCLATIICAVWLSMCFLAFGGLYAFLGHAIGLQRMAEFESALGVIYLPGKVTSIGRVSLIFFGVAMIVGSFPINFYWLKRLRRENRQG